MDKTAQEIIIDQLKLASMAVAGLRGNVEANETDHDFAVGKYHEFRRALLSAEGNIDFAINDLEKFKALQC